MAFIEVPHHDYEANENGTAERIADEWRNSLAWSEELNRWLIRRKGESIWRMDTLVQRTAKAMETCQRQSIGHNLPRLSTLRNLKNSLELAKPLLAVELRDFDTNPWALNTPDGVINLQTGELIQACDVVGRYRMSTRVSPKRIETPLWDQHLRMLTHGDIEIIAYLKRLAGATLIGDQNLKPHISPQLNGLGRNGKGVYLQALGWSLGDYAQFASTRLLTTTENSHTTEQAGLRGMRLVVVEEVKRINSSLLKDLTGGGMMRARRIRADDEEFLKSWTIWFNNNGPMMFSGDTSDGLWQRVPRIDFGVGIPINERIDDMVERLKEEASGILQWALDGLAEFRALGGLYPPESVKKATQEGRMDADPLSIFLRERYDFGVDEKEIASDFMRDLTNWMKVTGEVGLGGRRAVYDELRSRFGLNVEYGSKGKFYIIGIKKKIVEFGGLYPGIDGLGWGGQN